MRGVNGVVGDEVDFDKELQAQGEEGYLKFICVHCYESAMLHSYPMYFAAGVGNILSGMVGCPHNYLSYSNRWDYKFRFLLIERSYSFPAFFTST